MGNPVTINFHIIIAVVIVFIPFIDAASIPEMDDITANECDYFQEMTVTQKSNKLFNRTNIMNETIEIQFDIKLSNSCNSWLCNILYIGNDKTQYPSFAINGITNYIELSINTSHNNTTYQIPNASSILPADNQYYNIYLYISPNIHILRINYTLVMYDYRHVLFPVKNISYYHVYTSDLWHDSVNASIRNLCITSNIDIKSHGVMNCGEVIEGELKSRSDVNYYYFNLLEAQSILLDACSSWFDTYLYLYHKKNLSILLEADDDEFCKLQTVLWITSLPADEYILAVSGYETFRDHDYGGWELEIICDKHYNYSYIPLYEYEISWLQAELECRKRFGTTLATIVTSADLEEVRKSMPNTMKYSDLWIGLYDNNHARSEWKWIDGTTCDMYNSTDAPCMNHSVKWRLNPSDISKYGTYLSWFTSDTETVLRRVEAMDQQNGKDGMICNAPNGKYTFVNCDNNLSHCWTDMGCCDDAILEADMDFNVSEFKPAMAVWDSRLFIVGLNQIHYTNIDLSEPDNIKWDHLNILMYDNNNQSLSYNTSITQWYSQYESFLYIYVTNITHGIVISINLDNLEIQSEVSPERMADVCVVADKYNVFILSGSTIKIYDINEKRWTESGIFHHVYAACALDQSDNYIYIFGKSEYTLYKYDIHKDVFVVVDNTPNLCYTEQGRGITERNDKIYLHGCSVGSWKTIIYDIKSETFQSYSINMRNITNKNIPYYQSGQLAKLEDNVILLFHTTDTQYPSWGSLTRNNGTKLYYAITDPISINVQQTETDINSSVWPTDGFDINYYVNDFTNFSHMTYNMRLISYTTNININQLITLNISNDSCICNGSFYKCYNCHQHFDLNNHLSVEENDINEINFTFAAINESNTSIVPENVTIKLQRCNIWFKNKTPYVETTLFKTHDAKIEFSFNLSNNCYSKTENFAVNITAQSIKLYRQLVIKITNSDSAVYQLCDKNGKNCHTINDEIFSFEFDPSDIDQDQAIEVFMQSNSIDLYIESLETFEVQHEHNEVAQIVISVVVVIIVIILVISGYLYWRNKRLKRKVAEQKKHKKRIYNPMVIAISVGHYMDDAIINMFCPELDGIDRDYENIKNFCRLYKYQIFPKKLQIEWTQEQIVQFLKQKANDLSDNIKDDNNNDKYDSVFVLISAHGYKKKIISSDYKTISKTAIHRIFSTSLPHLRMLPRVFLFDCCDGDQTKGIYSQETIMNTEDLAEDSISLTTELEQVIGKDSQIIPECGESKQQEPLNVNRHLTVDDIELTALKTRGSAWQKDEANPDFKLCLIHAANEGFQSKMNMIDGSYLIYELIKRLIENASKKHKTFFGDIVDKIQLDLHDKGVQQTTSSFNNYTRYLIFEVNDNGDHNNDSVTEIQEDDLVNTEIQEEELKDTESDNALKIKKDGKSYSALNEAGDVDDISDVESK